jgi:predicted dinucleotide-binding enzyme
MKFILAPIGMSVNKNIIKLVKMSKIVKSFNSIKIESDKEGKNRCVANR